MRAAQKRKKKCKAQLKWRGGPPSTGCFALLVRVRDSNLGAIGALGAAAEADPRDSGCSAIARLDGRRRTRLGVPHPRCSCERAIALHERSRNDAASSERRLPGLRERAARLDREPLHLPPERRRGDAELARDAAEVAVAARQRRLDRAPLRVLHRLGERARRLAGAARRRPRAARAGRRRRGSRARARAPRPARSRSRARGRCRASRASTRRASASGVSDLPARRCALVVALRGSARRGAARPRGARASGGIRSGTTFEPVVEVLAEAALRDRAAEVLVRRGDHADVHLDGRATRPRAGSRPPGARAGASPGSPARSRRSRR